MLKRQIIFLKLLGGLIFLLLPFLVEAEMSSTNYQIKTDSLNSGGLLSSSTNYKLTDTLAEAVMGEGASVNYKLKDGLWYMINTYLTLEVDSATKDLGTLIAGTPVTGQSTITVTTDAWDGYTLSVFKNHQIRHTNGTNEIADHNGTVAIPGFSLPLRTSSVIFSSGPLFSCARPSPST